MATIATAHAELCRLRRDIAQIEGRLVDEDRLVLEPPHAGNTGEGAASEAEHPSSALFSSPGERQALPGPEAFGFRSRKRRGRLPFAVPALDGALGGGLLLSALHEIRVEETRDGGAAAGFALALLACLAGQGEAPWVLWISGAESRREAGDLYGPGLMELGLDPARLIRVAVRQNSEALWAFEAALTCRGLAMAVCEMRRPALSLTATRRCALRAREAGVTGLVLRLGGDAEPSAAETRLRLSPWPAGEIGGFAPGVGRMAWRIALEKNRGGRTGFFTVEWNAHERCFRKPSDPAEGRPLRPHPESLASSPAHGPSYPPGDGGEGKGRRIEVGGSLRQAS